MNYLSSEKRTIVITIEQIPLLRLQSQMLVKKNQPSDPAEVVQRLGAMQAQDLIMAKWALGVRTRNSTESGIEKAIAEGRILRTHVMRPTWHFVSPDDIRWMLKLTAPFIKRILTSRHKSLGISSELIIKSNKLLENALKQQSVISRGELTKLFELSGIRTNENRLSHLLMEAELDGIICSGELRSGRQTYRLLDSVVPPGKSFSKEESVLKLASRYFTGHAPATIKDFQWWSGIPGSELRGITENLSGEFFSEKTDSGTYILPSSFSDELHFKAKDSILLLPGYDEFLIGYRNRDASVPLELISRHVSVNGIFYPVIVRNGLVTGFWKRKQAGKEVRISFDLLIPPDKKMSEVLSEKEEEYRKFCNRVTT